MSGRAFGGSLSPSTRQAVLFVVSGLAVILVVAAVSFVLFWSGSVEL